MVNIYTMLQVNHLFIVHIHIDRKNKVDLQIMKTEQKTYSLFLGWKKIGSYPNIAEAKKEALAHGVSGVYSVVGENYRDSWFISKMEIAANTKK